MPMRTLGARFKLEGEDEFNRVMKQLNAGSATLRSEMVRLQAQYKGQTDSVEFLSEKSELLTRTLNQQKEMTAATRAMHESASKAFADAAKKVAELEAAHSVNNEELEIAKAAYADAELTLEKYATKLNLAEAKEFDLEHQIEETNQAINGQGKEMKGLGDAAGTLADKLGIQLPKGAQNALNSMGKLSTGTVAAMGAAAAGVVALIKTVQQLQETTIQAAAMADEIMSRSTQMNISAQQYQALQFASPFVDVDVDTMASSLSKITKLLGQAASGSEETREQFRALGVSITNDVDGSLRSSYDVWIDTMDAIGQMTDTTKQDIAAQELLGKSASELAPIYREGTGALREYIEEGKNNYAMSEVQLEALGRVDDAVQHLHLTEEKNKNMIAAEWAPTAEKALTTMDRLFTAAGKALVDSGIIQGFGELVQFAFSLLDPIASLLESADSAPGRLQPVYEVLHGIAGVIAWIADAANVVIGLVQTLTVVGAKQGLTRIGNALGYGASSGTYSNMQKWQQSYDAHYAAANGNYYDENLGTWIGNYGYNATGNDNWRGGLTWVGEAGPELVALPRGSQIANAQDSMNMAGDIYYVTLNVDRIEDLQDIIDLTNSAKVISRMNGRPR